MKKAGVPTVPGSDGLLQVPCLAIICIIWLKKLWHENNCTSCKFSLIIWLTPFTPFDNIGRCSLMLSDKLLYTDCC
jgi:hypothetical protein